MICAIVVFSFCKFWNYEWGWAGVTGNVEGGHFVGLLCRFRPFLYFFILIPLPPTMRMYALNFIKCRQSQERSDQIIRTFDVYASIFYKLFISTLNLIIITLIVFSKQLFIHYMLNKWLWCTIYFNQPVDVLNSIPFFFYFFSLFLGTFCVVHKNLLHLMFALFAVFVVRQNCKVRQK